MNAAVVFSLYFYTILGTVGAAAETQPVRRFLCQTRLTSRKPTCDNIFREEARGASGAPEVEFNHGDVSLAAFVWMTTARSSFLTGGRFNRSAALD